MSNRFQASWNQLQEIKQRFAALFSPEATQSKEFRKEMLTMYRRAASKKMTKKTKDERLLKSMLLTEASKLERSLFPNVFVRTFHRLFVGADSMITVHFPRLQTPLTTRHIHSLSQEINNIKLKNVWEPMLEKLRKGDREISIEVAVSLKPDEIVKYTLNISPDEKNRPTFKNCEISLLEENGGPAKILSLLPGGQLDINNAYDLLKGRPIKVDAEKWLIPDLLDRNELGHIKLSTINIADFNVDRELDRILPAGMVDREQTIKDFSCQLQAGKSVDLALEIVGTYHHIQLEAKPIKRLVIVLNANTGERTSIEKLRRQSTGPNIEEFNKADLGHQIQSASKAVQSENDQSINKRNKPRMGL